MPFSLFIDFPFSFLIYRHWTRPNCPRGYVDILSIRICLFIWYSRWTEKNKPHNFWSSVRPVVSAPGRRRHLRHSVAYCSLCSTAVAARPVCRRSRRPSRSPGHSAGNKRREGASQEDGRRRSEMGTWPRRSCSAGRSSSGRWRTDVGESCIENICSVVSCM